MRSLGALSAAALLVLTGCSGNDEPDQPSPGNDDAKSASPLDEAWTAPGPEHMFEPVGDGAGSSAWVHDGTLAVVGWDQIVGVDPTTGEERWQLPLPGEVLLSSYGVNAAGVGAVLVQTDDLRVLAIAIDVTKGKRRWATRVTPAEVADDASGISVGANTVAVTTKREGAQRLAIGDGSPLGHVCRQPATTLVGCSTISDGRYVVVAEHKVPVSRYVVYNQDTGRRVSTHPAGEQPTVSHVVSDDPLLVVGKADDGTYVRDLSKRDPATFGPEVEAFDSAVSAIQIGDKPALYFSDAGLVAWADIATDELTEITVLHKEEVLAGIHAGQLITYGQDPEEALGETQVRRIDPEDPERAEVLGITEFDPRPGGLTTTDPAIVVGDLLIVVESTLTAYQLPASGDES